MREWERGGSLRAPPVSLLLPLFTNVVENKSSRKFAVSSKSRSRLSGFWEPFPDHLHRVQEVGSNVRREDMLQDVATSYHRGCREFLM
jgi:hypothetical protein